METTANAMPMVEEKDGNSTPRPGLASAEDLRRILRPLAEMIERERHERAG